MSARRYTDAQQRAIEATGEVFVAAAAGSGKTTVLVDRITRALTLEAHSTDSVVAMTYTRLAAAEMRNRIARKLLAEGHHQLVGELESAPIGTIHNLCTRFLRQYPHAAGVDPGFAIIDEVQGAYLRRRALDDTLEEATGDPAALALLTRYGRDRVCAYLRRAHDAGMQRVDASVRFTADPTDTVARADAQLLQQLSDSFRDRYELACMTVGGLDFDVLQHRFLQLLDDPDVARKVRETVRVVLVDEFQDTNRLQCEIIDRIGAACTFVVGDEWQSIYRFRKADVAVFRERAAAAEPIRMAENFRSRSEVIDVVNHLFARAFAAGGEDGASDGAPAGAAAYEPVVHMRGPGERRVQLLLAPDQRDEHGVPPREVEAAAVGERIARLMRDGVRPHDIAILMSSGSNADLFEAALASRGIHSVRTSSKGYYEQQQVVDVLALLRWVRDRHDSLAAMSVLAAPYVGLQLSDLYELRYPDPPAPPDDAGDRWRPRPRRMWDAVCDSEHPAVVRARALRERLEELAQSGSLVDVVSAAIHDSGYAELVLSRPDGRRRYANMRKLVELAAAAADIGEHDLARFLDLVAAQQQVSADIGEATVADETTGAVRIMSIHAAKGLEFDHVFVVDCGNRGNADQSPGLLVDEAGDAWFETVDLDGGKVSQPDRFCELLAAEREEDRREERRKYYVALTRAREQLFVVGSLGRDWKKSPVAWICDGLGVDATSGAPACADASLPVDVIVLDAAPAPATSVEAVTAPSAEVPEVVLQPVPQPVDPPVDADAWQRRRHADDRLRFAAARGDRMHHVVEQALRLASRDGHARAVDRYGAEPVVGAFIDSPRFAALVAAGARPEVPYVASCRNGCCGRTGRFDILATGSGEWHVVDLKSALDEDDDDAWAAHESQMVRYAAACMQLGAPTVRVTLVDLSRDGRVVERLLGPDDVGDAAPVSCRVQASPAATP